MPEMEDPLTRRLKDIQSLVDQEVAYIPRPLFTCLTCGRSITCSPTEALHYLREGWPVCCRASMALSRVASRAPTA